MASLQFTSEDWARVSADTLAWWNGELKRPLVYLAVTDLSAASGNAAAAGVAPSRKAPYSYQSNYPLDMPVDQLVDQYEPYFAATRFYADSFPWVWVNFGPGILAGFLGSEVNSVTDPSETVWFNPLKNVQAEALDLCFDTENIWWKRVQEVTAAFVERYGGQMQVGHTDLGGNLDVLASFLTTEQLLFDVVEKPEDVLRLSRQITEHWLQCYDALDGIIRSKCSGTSTWVPLWAPGKTYMLQSDFAYMIGPKMFERFVMPDLAACCDHLDYAFYHLDGKGQIPHLDQLLSLSRLRGIQWIPGDGQPSPDQWLDLLKRIRDAGKLCQVLVSPEGARRIVKNLGGEGFLLLVNSYGQAFQNPAEVEGFLETLRQEDISQQ